MKSKVLTVVLLILVIFSFFSYVSSTTPYHNGFVSKDSSRNEQQTEKTYMKRLMEGNTRPLGLKEDKTLNQFLGQPQIKWVIRSEQRHILN